MHVPNGEKEVQGSRRSSLIEPYIDFESDYIYIPTWDILFFKYNVFT